ncbi:MAG: ABC transporter ATP-binding protein [Candidatus Gastranaerophilales bacterium]|nr:ABC transporter ATP-binding protein [Candidatus Gastranaerophilales bacterium]
MIRIEDLSVSFGSTEAVKNVTLKVADGEILGVVGESGSGKSVTALTLMGLTGKNAEMTSGRILFDEEVLAAAGVDRDKALYRTYQGSRMSMVFQEPMTSLNPTKKAGRQVEEMLLLHRDAWEAKVSSGKKSDLRAYMRQRVLELFVAVGLKDAEKVYESYPHQLSGGMRQRVMIAMAVILRPALIVCDEPTTALDVTIQNQIIELLKEINERQKNSMLFITHDLNLARRLCHRVAVMKDGRVVEMGTVEEIFGNPKEDYTIRLMEAVPSRVKKHRKEKVDDAQKILEVKDLSVYYQEGSNSLFGRGRKQCAVKQATFDIRKGEILGLVGESGCGKTSLSRAILGMNRDVQGSVVHYSTRPQMIFQDPYSSLNPGKTIGWLLQEPLRAMGKLEPARKMSETDMEAAAYDMLRKVGIEETYFSRKPSQLSGGQRQRVSIGQALIAGPGLVIADEPVSALDVTIQAQIMELMLRLQEEMKLSYLFISHDINVVYQMSDRIMVMKDGRIIEMGDTEEVFNRPKEDYTKLLLSVG